MKATRTFGKLLLAAIFTVGVLLSATSPIYAADLTGKTITAVDVSGNLTVPETKIMAVVKVKPGDKFNGDAIKQDLHSIYELGSFFDVVANFTEVPEGVKVSFTVLENPGLRQVVIQGNTRLILF